MSSELVTALIGAGSGVLGAGLGAAVSRGVARDAAQAAREQERRATGHPAISAFQAESRRWRESAWPFVLRATHVGRAAEQHLQVTHELPPRDPDWPEKIGELGAPDALRRLVEEVRLLAPGMGGAADRVSRRADAVWEAVARAGDIEVIEVDGYLEPQGLYPAEESQDRYRELEREISAFIDRASGFLVPSGTASRPRWRVARLRWWRRRR